MHPALTGPSHILNLFTNFFSHSQPCFLIKCIPLTRNGALLTISQLGPPPPLLPVFLIVWVPSGKCTIYWKLKTKMFLFNDG